MHGKEIRTVDQALLNIWTFCIRDTLGSHAGFFSGGRPIDKSRDERLDSCPGKATGTTGFHLFCLVTWWWQDSEVLGARQLLLSVSMHACSRATLFCQDKEKSWWGSVGRAFSKQQQTNTQKLVFVVSTGFSLFEHIVKGEGNPTWLWQTATFRWERGLGT